MKRSAVAIALLSTMLMPWAPYVVAQQEGHHDDAHHDDAHHDDARHEDPHHGDAHPGYVEHKEWRKGYRMRDSDWRRGARIDYRTYHLKPPPRGYEWREVDGNYVMAAIATGVITSVVAASLR